MRRLKVVTQADKGAPPLSRPSTLPHRHVISLHDLNPAEIEFLLDLGQRVKAQTSHFRNAWGAEPWPCSLKSLACERA